MCLKRYGQRKKERKQKKNGNTILSSELMDNPRYYNLLSVVSKGQRSTCLLIVLHSSCSSFSFPESDVFIYKLEWPLTVSFSPFDAKDTWRIYPS